jgi:diadenosine tetraphosphatase ApaH/serine/threonine PP2A family protein phosphatase
VISGDTQWFSSVANQTVKRTADNLTRESLRFLETLPEHIDSNGVTVYHGGPNRLQEFVYENDHERFCRVFDPFEVSVVVFGHTHAPLEEICGDKTILNPSSVGQPRGGDPRASYGIYDTVTKKFEIHRVTYDYRAVQQAIKEAGLPQLMADRLAYGK